MKGKNITVMIADDHVLMREGLKQLLELGNNIEVIAQSGDGEETIKKAVECKPDVILLDINMPKLNGIEVLRRLKDMGQTSKIIMLTIHDAREYLFETMKIGANGYILKDSDSDSLVKAIKDVYAGKTYIQPSIASMLVDEINSKGEENKDLAKIKSLTRREYEVLTLLAEGINNKEIADKLYISEKTVKNHVSNIFKKIKVNDRIQAAIFAYKNNIKKI
ncbi:MULTISPECIES: response regulator [Tissierellales]|mgnify:FL=1|jgi:DNA-binding NarL/FixJ family response regulator|uniref:Response regulator transcription factor n=1 Tax=Acidilutibacter cellobiosedens TaxID=2507161 RepID=A0A410QE24_9FIRM|nr:MULTISPECIES: response regulator transcription factor [Tissierellales]MBE6083553.1 response regulator transcription factor [Tissierellaceae bacterium]QAT62292.1 response regulator transcription factor [Acidilutibacter cellobiosedens]SCL96841.1 Protease production enhancer protein [Sporanaerobacter sp. PP17-6a]